MGLNQNTIHQLTGAIATAEYLVDYLSSSDSLNPTSNLDSETITCLFGTIKRIEQTKNLLVWESDPTGNQAPSNDTQSKLDAVSHVITKITTEVTQLEAQKKATGDQPAELMGMYLALDDVTEYKEMLEAELDAEQDDEGGEYHG